MAKPKPSPAAPLASPAGRLWLAAQLVAAEHAERHGPGGEGWGGNETKRASVKEHADFLRALIASLT